MFVPNQLQRFTLLPIFESRQSGREPALIGSTEAAVSSEHGMQTDASDCAYDYITQQLKFKVDMNGGNLLIRRLWVLAAAGGTLHPDYQAKKVFFFLVSI